MSRAEPFFQTDKTRDIHQPNHYYFFISNHAIAILFNSKPVRESMDARNCDHCEFTLTAPNHRCTGRDPQVPTFLPVLSGPRHTLNHHTVQYSAPLTVHLYPTYIIEYTQTQQHRYVLDIRLNMHHIKS